MSTPRFKTGLFHTEDRVDPARFYYGDQEEDPPQRIQVNSQYTTWIEDDGTVGIRRGTSVSIGASATYSANYDALDWGN